MSSKYFLSENQIQHNYKTTKTTINSLDFSLKKLNISNPTYLIPLENMPNLKQNTKKNARYCISHKTISTLQNNSTLSTKTHTLAYVGDFRKLLIKTPRIDYIITQNIPKQKEQNIQFSLNSAICKYLKSHNIQYIISLHTLSSTFSKPFIKVLLRNIRLCNKYHIKWGIFPLSSSFLDLRSSSDLKRLEKFLIKISG